MKRIAAWAIICSLLVMFIGVVLLSLYVAVTTGNWWFPVGLGIALATPWAMSVIEG